MKRVLLVSYYFPPLGGIGSVRAASFARHLADYGWDATVLTPRDGAYHRDPNLTVDEDQVIRTWSFELSRTGKQMLRTGGTDTTPADVHGSSRLLRSLARRYLYFPDAQIGWYPPAILSGLSRIRPGTFDAIYSSSLPITAHLVARTLHRHLGVPWVAEFRDPWCARLPGRPASKRRAISLERNLAREASALVTVSPSWAQMFSTEWGREVSVITNGHDGVAGSQRDPSSDVLTFGYVGTFYPGSQNLDALWTAAAALNRAGRRTTAIRVIGAYDAVMATRAAACGAGDLLTFTGYLPHTAVAAELTRCTALVVAGQWPPREVERGCIPAKTFEYLATDRQIIYVGDCDTDAADLLRRFDGTRVVPADDLDGVYQALLSVPDQSVTRDTSEFSRSSLASRLAALLDRVAS